MTYDLKTYDMRFLWLGKLALGALVLILACDLAQLCNFPMHLYTLYLGVSSLFVAPYFFVRRSQARQHNKVLGAHQYRLFFFCLVGFGMTLAWSLKYYRLEGAFVGMDLDIMGAKALDIITSYFAIKAAMLACAVVALADAFHRSRMRGLKHKLAQQGLDLGRQDTGREGAP